MRRDTRSRIVSAGTKDPCGRQPREFCDHAQFHHDEKKLVGRSYQESFVVVDVVVVVVLRLNPHSSKGAPPKIRNAPPFPLQGHQNPIPSPRSRTLDRLFYRCAAVDTRKSLEQLGLCEGQRSVCVRELRHLGLGLRLLGRLGGLAGFGALGGSGGGLLAGGLGLGGCPEGLVGDVSELRW